MILIAIAIALPLSYLIALKWLESFAYRIELEWWLFGVAGVIDIVDRVYHYWKQTLKAAHINPIECIRN